MRRSTRGGCRECEIYSHKRSCMRRPRCANPPSKFQRTESSLSFKNRRDARRGGSRYTPKPWIARVEGSPSGCPCTAGGRRSSATFSGTTGNHDLAPPASFPPSLTLDHMLDGQVSTRWNPPRCHLLCISLECGNPDCPSLSTDPGPLGIHSFFFFFNQFFSSF